jgi:hypothetical protein
VFGGAEAVLLRSGAALRCGCERHRTIWVELWGETLGVRLPVNEPITTLSAP